MLRADTNVFRLNVPSVKLLMANILRCRAKNSSVASGSPSRIIMWTVMRPLKTTVHVESRRRNCRARKTSEIPASPECVATRMCSMYLVFGGAACRESWLADVRRRQRDGDRTKDYIARTLILVAPLTDFSKEPDMARTGADGEGDQARRDCWPRILRQAFAGAELDLRGGRRSWEAVD